MLGQIKDSHNDIKGVGYYHYCHKGFKYPFKKHKGFKVMHIILFYDHLYQFVAHDKGQDNAGNRNNHCFGEVLYHGKDTAIPY